MKIDAHIHSPPDGSSLFHRWSGTIMTILQL